MKLNIQIIGDQVKLFLQNGKGDVVSNFCWTDQRDLSEKLLVKIDSLLWKNELTIRDIEKIDFNCDSPYFGQSKNIELNENFSSQGKCGFMAWQVGEVTAKILNFCR